jgi:hypothetical protein
MSPDVRGSRWRSVDAPGSAPEDQALPLDVRLEALDAELRAAGTRARAAGRGSTQPTRYFSQQLRSRVVSLLTRPGPRG